MINNSTLLSWIYFHFASIDTACMQCRDYGTFVGEDHRGKNSNKKVVAVV